MSLNTIKLHLIDGTYPSLERFEFHHKLHPAPLIAVRGKTAGAYSKMGTFQWTSGVQGLTILILRTLLAGQNGNAQEKSPILNIEGGKGSLAAALDSAIDKRTSWIIDMFGVDSDERPLARRIIKRSNPGGRRAGLIALSLTREFFAPGAIEVFCSGKTVADARALEYLLHKAEKGCGALDTGIAAVEYSPPVLQPIVLRANNGDQGPLVGFPVNQIVTGAGNAWIRVIAGKNLEFHLLSYTPFDEIRSVTRPLCMRIQFQCMFGHLFGSLECDCSSQLNSALGILEEEKGLLILVRNSINDHARGFEVCGNGLPIRDHMPGGEMPTNDEAYSIIGRYLKDQEVSSVKLLTNSARRVERLKASGLQCEQVPLVPPLTPCNFNGIYSRAMNGHEPLRKLFDTSDSLLYFKTPAPQSSDVGLLIFDGNNTLWEDSVVYENIIGDFINSLIPFLPALSHGDIRTLLDNKQLSLQGPARLGPQGFTTALRTTWQELNDRLSGNLPYPHTVIEEAPKRLEEIGRVSSPNVVPFLKELKSRGRRLVLFLQGPRQFELNKLLRFKLSSMFDAVAVTDSKSVQAYKELLSKLPADPGKVLVIGNHLELEVYPAIEAGLRAAHYRTPYGWELLNQETSGGYNYHRYHRVYSFAEILDLDAQVNKQR